MTATNYRASEALYTVISRDKDAERLFKDWAKNSRVSVRIENNRMHIFEQHTLTLFQLNWNHSWGNITIWDCWHKRHLNT